MKQISISNAVKIKNQRVKPFDGEKKYLATGGLIEDTIKTEVITYKSKPTRADLLLTKNQLIVARMKGTNKVLLIDKNTSNLIVSTGFLVLEVQEGWHPRFLFHYLVSSFFQKQKDKLSIGATQKAINNEKFKEILIPEISYEDQKRIVKILDEADSLRQKRKQVIGLLDEYLKSVFLEMFGDPVKNTKSWTIQKFNKLGTLDRGRSKHRPRNAPELLGGAHPLIQTGDVTNAGIFIKKYSSTYSDIGLKQSKKWPRGTLCITIAANIARTGILNFDACFPDSVVGFVADTNKTNSLFVHFWMSFFQKILEASAPESAQKNINLRILRELDVINPPINLQNKFSEMVNKTEVIKQKMITQSEEMEKQFQALMQKSFIFN